jgi:hypothetical protein
MLRTSQITLARAFSDGRERGRVKNLCAAWGPVTALGQWGDPRLAKQEWGIIPESRNYWIGAQKNDPKGRNDDEEAYGDEPLRGVNLGSFRIGKYRVNGGAV